jgi:serine/threonine-protein kinase PknK
VANATPETPRAAETQLASKPPADALDNGTVPDVAGLKGVVDAEGKATFTWENPQPKDGDTYKWRVYAVGESSEYQATTGTTVQVALNPAVPTCLQVMIVRSDGGFSPLEDDSIACINK